MSARLGPRSAGAALAALLALAAVAGGADAATPFRVATFNVFAGTHDMAAIAARVREQDADVVCLQEVTPRGAQLLRRDLAGAYPNVVFAIHPRWDGRAILSRTPVRNVRHRPSRHGRNGWVVAEVERDGRWLQLASVHLEPVALWSAWRVPLLPLLMWQTARIQEAEMDDLLAELVPGVPTIVAGDLNGDADGVAARRLRERGFVDAYGAVTPDPDARATIRFALAGIDLGRRIDFVFHGPGLRTRASGIADGRPSDHDAIWADLEWEDGAVGPAAASRGLSRPPPPGAARGGS